ncbi:hypothetical protein [Tardiphaga sp. 813_E8_N1_3]|uniref:hypothetical protein n=1 Tax=Tardiphaga sp. 813_E8_N1_3 TaxID=3240760 RepID=UPI003F1FAC49
MRGCLGIVLAVFLFLTSHHAWAKSDHIDSALSAIDSANGQARLDLSKGFYKATSGSSYVVIEVPADMGSVLKFDYRFRSLASASWEFDQTIFVSLYAGGKCVKIGVKKFVYSEGGFISGSSDQTIVPGGDCRESEPLARINDFLRLAADPGDFFRGAAFVALSTMKKCTSSACTALVKGLPIRRATFFGSVSPGGQPLPALAATFKEGARLILPQNGMLVLAANSGAVFNDLVYDLEASTGSALLNKFSVNLSDGLISGGQTIFRIGPQSKFTAEEVKFEKNDVAVKISRGALSGELGEGTSILLSNDQAKTSTINVRYAKLTLAGLSYEGAPGQSSLSFQRGILSTQLENAEFWFSDRNSIRVGYTNINFVLGCPENVAVDTCAPVNWSKAGLSVYGTINAFSTTLVGGQFNISNVGTIQLKGGQIAADTLAIDSKNKTSPITGKINKFEISLEGQDLHLDGSTIASLARADIKANDLLYKVGQSLPVGTVKISGMASRVEGGKIGKVRFDAGAKFDLQIDRRDNEEPEVIDGNIDGEAKVTMDGGNWLQASVHVERLRYFRGLGDAILKLTATAGQYVFSTPSDHQTADAVLLKSEIDVKSIKLAPTLSQPIVIGPTDVKASQGKWVIDPVVGVPFKFAVPIAQQEIVYAPIKDKVTHGTVCAPKVMLRDQSPEITGKIDVFASSAGGKIKIYDNKISAGIDVQADDRGCQGIADLVCFLVGTAFGGPIGGAALAVACDNNIEGAKAKLTDQVRDESIKKVAESKFEFNY